MGVSRCDDDHEHFNNGRSAYTRSMEQKSADSDQNSQSNEKRERENMLCNSSQPSLYYGS